MGADYDALIAAGRRGFGSIQLYTHEKMTENTAYYRRRSYRETHRRHQHDFDLVFFRKALR